MNSRPTSLPRARRKFVRHTCFLHDPHPNIKHHLGRQFRQQNYKKQKTNQNQNKKQKTHKTQKHLALSRLQKGHWFTVWAKAQKAECHLVGPSGTGPLRDWHETMTAQVPGALVLGLRVNAVHSGIHKRRNAEWGCTVQIVPSHSGFNCEFSNFATAQKRSAFSRNHTLNFGFW